VAGSIVLIAILVSRFSGRRDGNGGYLQGTVRRALRFSTGPFSISVVLHVVVLLFLIVTVHQTRGRELLMVEMVAGGGGGSNGDEMAALDMPDVQMPDVPPIETPSVVSADAMKAIDSASGYVRSSTGGIGTGRGGGVGNGFGSGFGSGWGGFVGDLGRSGLDVVLVIDGTGSMKPIIEEVKARMAALVQAVHRLVPVARIAVVVYGGKGEPLQVQPLTLSPSKLESFLANIHAQGGEEWEEDMLGACRTAIERMNFRPYAKKTIVLVGDSPPKKEDFNLLLTLVKQFAANGGRFNTIDVTAEEHERFERELAIAHGHPWDPTSPLPQFHQQTRQAYKVIAGQGGGAMRSLTADVQVNQQVLISIFGEKWERELARFGKSISQPLDTAQLQK
jgi:hypothetical protein